MPTSLGSLEFTLEDWTQEYSNQENWELFLSYCEETFCIPRDEFVTKEAFIAYYEYFQKYSEVYRALWVMCLTN